MTTIKFQRAKVIWLSASHLLHDIYTSFLSPLIPLLIEKLSLSFTQISFLSVAQNLPNLLNPAIGLMADRIKMRYLIIITPAISGIIMSSIGMVNSFAFLIVLMLSVGLSSALYHVPTPVMIRKMSGKEPGKGMSYYMTGGELARMLGPLIIVAIVSRYGLEGSWRLIPFGLAGSVLLFFKFKSVDISSEMQQKRKTQTQKRNIKKYLVFFISIALFVFLRSFMKQGLGTLLPTYLKQIRHYEFAEGGIFYALFMAAGVLGTFTSGRYIDKFGARNILLFIATLSPLLMLAFVFSSGTLSLIIMLVLGFLVIAQGPVLLTIVNSKKTTQPALVNSIYITISFVIGSMGMLVTGVLSDAYGLEFMYKIAGPISLLALPFVWIFTKESKDD